ncbi:MAG: nickel-type superoxide dismutase maturation protease [Acidobacteriota bacterium]
MENELPDATWKERLLYFLGRRQAFLIEGSSMKPTLSEGDAILIVPRSQIEINDIVLAHHPYKESVKILKRVSQINDNGSYILLGDNESESTDSRTFGPILPKEILGKAVCRLK